MSDIKLLLLLRSAVLAKHPRGWIVGVTDLPLKDFVEACNESELLTAEIEDGDGLCVIRYIIPDEKRPGIIIIKKQDEAKLNTPVPFSETKIQRLERERDEARMERDEARNIAKMAYTRLIGLGVSSHTPIQFMRDAIKAWDKEQKEEA